MVTFLQAVITSVTPWLISAAVLGFMIALTALTKPRTAAAYSIKGTESIEKASTPRRAMKAISFATGSSAPMIDSMTDDLMTDPVMLAAADMTAVIASDISLALLASSFRTPRMNSPIFTIAAPRNSTGGMSIIRVLAPIHMSGTYPHMNAACVPRRARPTIALATVMAIEPALLMIEATASPISLAFPASRSKPPSIFSPILTIAPPRRMIAGVATNSTRAPRAIIGIAPVIIDHMPPRAERPNIAAPTAPAMVAAATSTATTAADISAALAAVRSKAPSILSPMATIAEPNSSIIGVATRSIMAPLAIGLSAFFITSHMPPRAERPNIAPPIAPAIIAALMSTVTTAVDISVALAAVRSKAPSILSPMATIAAPNVIMTGVATRSMPAPIAIGVSAAYIIGHMPPRAERPYIAPPTAPAIIAAPIRTATTAVDISVAFAASRLKAPSIISPIFTIAAPRTRMTGVATRRVAAPRAICSISLSVNFSTISPSSSRPFSAAKTPTDIIAAPIRTATTALAISVAFAALRLKTPSIISPIFMIAEPRSTMAGVKTRSMMAPSIMLSMLSLIV